MKTLALATAAAFLPFTLSAADKPTPGAGNLRELLQQGLFEEEANRDTSKAAAAYADLVAQYDTQRAFAATALYRLAEIRAKEGNKAEAIALHQRLLAEFPNDEAFAKRSRERLAELGGKLPAAVAQADAPTEAEAKELAHLREIVKNSPDLLNAVGGPENMTPLTKAATNGWLAAASFLLDHGADPNVGNGHALRAAAGQGHKRMVELLLQRGADVNLRDPQNVTALYLASANDRSEVARVLLTHGADPNVVESSRSPTSPSYGTPLYAAISKGNDQLAKLLLEHKADPNLRTSDSFPLRAAVARRNLPLTKELLARGADANAPSYSDLMVLHRAAGAWPEIVPLLLDHGASVKVAMPQIAGEASGRTPFHYAIQAFPTYPPSAPAPDSGMLGKVAELPMMSGAVMEQLFKHWELLLAKGADINARDAGGVTPLHLAAGRADLPADALAWLIEHGADLNAEAKDGQTVFDYAHKIGNRRLELEQRFRLPKSPEKLAINWLLPKQFQGMGFGGQFERGFLAIPATGESDAPPTLQQALTKAFEGMSGHWPGNFSVHIYRKGETGKLEAFAEVLVDAGSNPPIVSDLPDLKWGDVLVLDQRIGMRAGSSNPKEELIKRLNSPSIVEDPKIGSEPVPAPASRPVQMPRPILPPHVQAPAPAGRRIR